MKRLFCSCAWIVIAQGCATSSATSGSSIYSSSSNGVELFSNSGWVASQTLQSAVFQLDWELDNRADEAVTIGNVKWTLNVGDTKEFEGTQALNVVIEAGTTKKGALKIPIDFDFSIETLQYHQERGPLDCDLLAQFMLSGATNGPEIAQWHGKLPAPRAPRVIVEGGGERERDSTRFEFLLTVMNENPFPLVLDELTYSLVVDNKPIDEKSLIEGEQTIAPASNASFEITPEIANRRLPHGRDQVPFELEAVMRMGGVEQRTPFRGVVDFSND